MSGFNRKDGSAPPATPPEGTPADAPHKSGRTTFDDRGRAVWEWQVQTGSFDLNADSQRVRALTDVELSLEEPEPARTGFKEEGFNPYGSEPAPSKRSPGANPYGSRALRRPEGVSYNPHRMHGSNQVTPAAPPRAAAAARPAAPPPRPAAPPPRPAAPPPTVRPGANPYEEAPEPPVKKTFNPFNAFKLGAAKKPPR